MAVVLKTTEPGRVPGVRIPLPPPHLSCCKQAIYRISVTYRSNSFRPCYRRACSTVPASLPAVPAHIPTLSTLCLSDLGPRLACWRVDRKVPRADVMGSRDRSCSRLGGWRRDWSASQGDSIRRRCDRQVPGRCRVPRAEGDVSPQVPPLPQEAAPAVRCIDAQDSTAAVRRRGVACVPRLMDVQGHNAAEEARDAARIFQILRLGWLD